MRRIQQGKKVLAQVWPEDFATTIDRLAEGGLRLIELPAHIGMLGTLPRKEEVNVGTVARMEACLHTLTIALRERLNRVGNVADDGTTTVREFATTGLQSPRNVGHAQGRMVFQVLNEIVGGLFKRLLRAGGQ